MRKTYPPLVPMTFRMPAELAEWLRERAAATGRPQVYLVTTALEAERQRQAKALAPSPAA